MNFKSKMQKAFFITLFIIINIGVTLAQSSTSNSLYQNYEQYKESAFNKKRIKHADIKNMIQKLDESNLFDIETAGKSLEGREIYLIKIGSGKTKVLAWSQMHGDESTATMALFDIFNFFRSDDEFNDLREKLLKKVTLYFIPMLNPDGAEKYQRRNALQIDLNRDALRLQFPESKILKSMHDSVKPHFGFNLHDQNTRYTSGTTPRSAAISFLAPPFNYEKDINDVRANTMKLIVHIYDELSAFIPGHIGRYSDDFEPRAFGDNFIKWGTSSVLIESGGWKNNREKQFIRKLNFIALLTAFNSIAEENYKNEDIQQYEQIPKNEEFLFDLLLRNLKIKFNDEYFLIDIGINQEEKNSDDTRNSYFKSTIEDLGDLSIYYGYEEFDCTGMEVIPGKSCPEEFSTMEEIKKLDFLSLYKQGYTSVVLNDRSLSDTYTMLPIDIILNTSKFENKIEVEQHANLIVKEKDDVRFTVINGFIYDLKSGRNQILNGLIIR